MRRALGCVFVTAASALVVLILVGNREASSLIAADVVSETAYIKAPTPGDGDQFGTAVALSADGTTMAVGATGEGSASRGINGDQKNNDADDSGAVYVYVRNKGEWTPQAFLKASNADSLDQFGTNVALSADGNTLVVGAYFEDGGGRGVNGNQADNSIGQAGAAYVFVRRGTTWTQQAYLKASNPGEAEEGDTFGYSIAVSGDGNTVAVGAPSEDSNASGINGNQADNSAIAAGAVYVFARNGSTWTQQAYVKSDVPPEFTAGDLFGYSVALNANGTTLAIGAYDEASAAAINGPFDNKLGGSGAVFVYTRTGTSWARTGFLKAKEQDRNDSMGASVAISDDGNTIAGGAADEDSLTTGINAARSGDSGQTDAPDDNSAGAVYVFVRSGTTWTQQANFKASNTGKNDWFGVKVALSGDGTTAAVSATYEDSNAKGINGNEADNSANDAGAVYLFRRSGTTWRQIAYVKGANTEEFDEFGTSVALTRDGRLMAVGAKFEDSAAAGVNGNQADNSLLDSGAVYVFSVGR
jgi:FG-GAP repeat